jgi:hypothetical protein
MGSLRSASFSLASFSSCRGLRSIVVILEEVYSIKFSLINLIEQRSSSGTRMKFEEWIVGLSYDVLTHSGPYPMGRLVQKFQVEGQVYLDFRKEESGEEYMYIVDATETYAIHTEPGEIQGTTNTVLPLTLGSQA